MKINDFEVSLEEAGDNGEHELLFTGELTFENSNPIYNYLLNKAYHLNSIKIILYSPINVDLSFLQLLIGFMDSRNKLGMNTYLDLNIDESTLDLLSKTGIIEKISSLQKAES